MNRTTSRDGNPFGTTTLSSSLTSQQAYDVTLFLKLPLTPSNIDAGNFMVDLKLIAPESSDAIDVDSVASTAPTLNTSSSVLALSRRPAILTYTSTLVNTANTLTGLPWYVLGWKKESEALAVPMFEGVQFAKGSMNVPNKVHLSIEPSPESQMQFYSASLRIVARFGGLRWLLYHHRFLSFFVFTTVFWGSSVISMLLVWLGLSMYLASSAEKKTTKKEGLLEPNGTVKSEPTDSDAAFDPQSLEDLSDTSRTFPTLARGQAPLRFSSGATRATKAKEEEAAQRIKKEGDGHNIDRSLANIPPMSPSVGLETEADDEDEDEGFGSEWRDSGIGTSREEERREEIRRRRKSGAVGSAGLER